MAARPWLACDEHLRQATVEYEEYAGGVDQIAQAIGLYGRPLHAGLIVTQDIGDLMEEQSLFRIGEASAKLGLHDKNSNTLRSWAEEFKDHLSQQANPEPGKPRVFTARDLLVLRAVRDYRLNHLQYDEIRRRLADEAYLVEPIDHDATDRAVDLTSQNSQDLVEHQVAQGQALIPASQVDALIAPLQRALDEWRDLAEDYKTRLASREERIAALEQRVDSLHDQLAGLVDRVTAPPQPQAPLGGNGGIAGASQPSGVPNISLERHQSVDGNAWDEPRLPWWKRLFGG